MRARVSLVCVLFLHERERERVCVYLSPHVCVCGSRQVSHQQGKRVVVEGLDIWNPSFDVTPANLITGIFTELGVALPTQDAEGHQFFDMPEFLRSASAFQQ